MAAVSAVDTTTAALWVATFGGRPCTERTIRRWVDSGRIPNLGSDRRILVDIADLAGSLAQDLTAEPMSAEI